MGCIAVALALFAGVIPAAAAKGPTGLVIVKFSAKRVTIGWRGTDHATGYRVYRDGVLISTVGRAARKATFVVPSVRSYMLGIGALTPTGERLSTITIRPRWAVVSTTVPSGPVRDVYPGQSIEAAVKAASAGDTVRVHAGTYPRVTITRSFSRQLVIEGESGVTIAGFTIRGGGGLRIQRLATTDENLIESGAHDVVFHGVSASLPTGSRPDRSCWYIRRSTQRITIQSSTGRGGWDVVKVYAPPPELTQNIVVRDNDLSGAWEDIIHVDGAVNMTIQHNAIKSPVDSPEHNDGVQSQHSSNLRIVRNTFSWTSVPPAGGANQAIMLGNLPSRWRDREVANTYVASNLVHHWNGGRPLIMNGTEGTRIVNNTFADSGHAAVNDASITISHQGAAGGQNPGLEIWNNILDSVRIDRGAASPAFLDTNLFSKRSAGMKGRNAIVADPLFANRTSYRLSRRSPARGKGSSRPGTPALALDGSRRSKPLNLGAHD
jgi:hypothetical protein